MSSDEELLDSKDETFYAVKCGLLVVAVELLAAGLLAEADSPVDILLILAAAAALSLIALVFANILDFLFQ